MFTPPVLPITVTGMPATPVELSEAAVEFVTERHHATLTTLRANGTPHVVAIAFTYQPETGLVRIITDAASQKVRNARRGGYAAVCQVDGARWLTLEGPATVVDTAPEVRDAENRFAVRYRPPRINPTRVVLQIEVARMLGSANLKAR